MNEVRISRNRYLQYEKNTGKILGFYLENQIILDDTVHQPKPFILIDDITYDMYLRGSAIGKKYKVINNKDVTDIDIREELSINEYKALKNARIVYEAHQRTSLPYSYEGNFYDVYYLRNNYFDQRFLEEISKKTTNEIKIQTINNRLITMTKEKFLDFYYSYTQHMKVINDKRLELLDQVLEAEDKEQVDAVCWDEDINLIIYPEDSIFMPLVDTSNLYLNYILPPNDDIIYGVRNGKWVPVTNDDIDGGNARGY